MITAKELRIGNLVNFEGDMISVTAGDIHYFDENLDSFDGIPLTPEILEKAGFEKSDFRTDILYNRLHIECADDGRFYYYIHIDGDDYYDWRALEIKHLHQLQNLYFALAGEELDINL